MILVLIQTISCDAGLHIDLWCDPCGFAFDVILDGSAADRRGPEAVWQVASAAGWTVSGDSRSARYRCPGCGPSTAAENSHLAGVG